MVQQKEGCIFKYSAIQYLYFPNGHITLFTIQSTASKTDTV